jgi:hypothetical protein
MQETRYRFYTLCLVGILVGGTLLTAVYSYFAFFPSGREDPSVEHADAIARVERALAPPLPTDHAPAPEPVDAIPESELPDLLSEMRRAGLNQPHIDRAWIALPAGQFNADQGTSAILGPDSATLEWIMNRARSSLSYGSVYAIRNMPQDVFQDKLQEIGRRWHKEIIQMEDTFLKVKNENLSFHNFTGQPRFRGYDFTKHPEIAALIILRACSSGGAKRTRLLLDHYLDLLRVEHIRSYPTGLSVRYLETQGFLSLLGQMDGLTEEGYIRARAVLDATWLDREQRDDFFVANVARQQSHYKELIKTEQIGGKQNTIHYLFGGRAEDALYRVFKPIMLRQIDRFCMAITEGDHDEISRAYGDMEFTRGIMNIGPSLNLSLSNPPKRSELFLLKGVRINEEVGFARLILGASHFRYAEGRYPDTIEEMVPEYLSASFLPSDSKRWAVYTIPRFRYPVAYESYHPKARTDPFAQAVARFVLKNNRKPNSPEEMKDYVSSEAEFESFQDKFRWCEARPLFIRFGKTVQSPPDAPSRIMHMVTVNMRSPAMILTPGDMQEP